MTGASVKTLLNNGVKGFQNFDILKEKEADALIMQESKILNFYL